MLEQACTVAADAHATQKDKLDRNYVDAHLRPIAEGAAVFGTEAEAVGWLHDILEDTGTTAQELREKGFSNHVVAAVESVTKGPPDEPYNALISRACAHPLGRLVKLVDNAWNVTCNPDLAQHDSTKAHELMTDKYVPARARLLEACSFTADSPEVLQMQTILNHHLARLHADG